MILSALPSECKSDSLVQLADDLSAFVVRSVQEASSFDEFERGAFERLLRMGQAAVDLFLQAQGNGDLGDSVLTSRGTPLSRSDVVQARAIRTIFGEHVFESFVYAQGPKQKIELRPIDARLNLPEGKASYLLQEFSQLFCVEKAFGVGGRQFETVFGQKLSVDVLEGINRAMGEQAELFLDALPKPQVAEEGHVLVVTADGKGVPLVKQDAQKVPAFDKKERPGNRRMATLGCVYTVDRYVRTPEQIVAALFRRDTDVQPADRPTACFKHYRGCFAEAASASAEPVPSAYGTWAWMVEEVRSRHQPSQPIVRIMDGQPILWEASDACLEEFLAELQETDSTQEPIDILDILHVSGYVWKAAKAFHSHKEHQEAFAEDRLLRILHGEVSGVVTGLRRMASQRGLKGEASEAVRSVCNYFENNAHRMRYNSYLQAGYPIASGVIEGACRHIIKDRMEQGGMRWTLNGAKAMLNVRAVCASSEWTKFNSWRQTEQAKLVHPNANLVNNYKGFHA